MKITPTHEARTERLFVRLTAEEAARLADAAALHGVTVSVFVRDAALRRSGSAPRVRRYLLASDAAETVRALTVIGAHVRGFSDSVQRGQTLTIAQVDACLTDVQAALARFKA